MATKDKDTTERKFDKKLPVQLSDEEKLHKGIALARILDEIEDKKQEQKDIGAEVKEMDAKWKELKGHLTSGVEERLVDVKEIADWKQKCVTLVRLDTGETIEERAMRADEIQKPLALSPGQSKVDGDKGKDGAGKSNTTTPPSKPTLVKDGKDKDGK